MSMKVRGRISCDPITVPRQAMEEKDPITVPRQAMEEKDTLNLFPPRPRMLRTQVGASVPSEVV